MTDVEVESYEGTFNLNINEYLEYRAVTAQELLDLLNKENNGNMGECTRTFLIAEGIIGK